MDLTVIRTLLDVADRLEYIALATDRPNRRLDRIVAQLRRTIDEALADLDNKTAA
jgi:hypothetical protein